MSLTPRELATRGYALTVLAAGWTATYLAWPDAALTTSDALTLAGCLLAAGVLLRQGIRLSVSRHFITLEDFVLVPLVLIYPAGWVMAVGAACSLAWALPSRSFRTRWYRIAFNSGHQPLLALASSHMAARMPGDGAVRVVAAAVAATLTWDLLSGLGSAVGVIIERGEPIAESYSLGDAVAMLRGVPVMAAFAVLVHQAGSADWPVLVAAGLVLLVQQLVSRAARADVIAAEQKTEREQLLRLVVGVGDRQRREVTSQIHDGPLQVVVATKVLLDSTISRLDAGTTPDRDQLSALSNHLSAAIDDLRSALHEGYRDRLVVAGLRDGLTEVLRKHEPAFPRGYRLSVDDRLDLNVDASIALLLILREAIVNAAKHSRAQSVAVSVSVDGTTVVGEVLDDGVGLERSPSAVRQQGHLGIALMQERAERAGGTTTVERREPGGTRVCVKLPMTPVSQRPVEDWERAPGSQPGS